MSLRTQFRAFRTRLSRTSAPNVARLMLLICAMLWGGSYPATKIALSAMPPQWLVFWRMSVAVIIIFAIFHRQIIPHLNRKIIVPSIILGTTYYGAMITQTVGLQTIDPGRSAFLTSAYCVLTPFAIWIVIKHRPNLLHLLAAVTCLAGVGFIALKPNSVTFSLSYGDILTLLGTGIFAFNLAFLGVYTQRFNPLSVTFVQFSVAGLLFLVGALVSEPLPNAHWFTVPVMGSFFYLLIGATVVAQLLQNMGLTHLPASTASILLCTESLFSLGLSALFFHEEIGVTSYIGFALIFTAVVMSVMKPRRKHVVRVVQTDETTEAQESTAQA